MKSKSICIQKQHLIAGIFLTIVVGCMIVLSQAVLRTNTSYSSKASEVQSPVAVVGSDEVMDWRTWPFVVRVEHPGAMPLSGKVPCTGSLIAPQWVITAAHCTKGLFGMQVSPKSIKVKFGTHSKENKDLQEVAVTELYNYNDEIKKEKDMADIALLKLEFAVNRDTVTLNTVTGNDLEQEDRMAVVLGWGLLEEGATIPAFDLRYGVLPLVSNTKANKKDWSDGMLHDSEMAAGFASGGVDACQGDSGGPLMVWNNSKWIMVGVVKKSIIGCGRPKKPGIYTRISFAGKEKKQEINYIKWLGEKMGDLQYQGVGTFAGSALPEGDRKMFEFHLEWSRDFERRN